MTTFVPYEFQNVWLDLKVDSIDLFIFYSFSLALLWKELAYIIV